MTKARKAIWPELAPLATAFFLTACGGARAAPEPAATEPPQDEQAARADAGPTEPEPAAEPLQPPPDPAQVKSDLLAAETSAFELAEPVFKQHCARCHVKGGKNARARTLKHLDMTSYPFGGHHADEISTKIRKVLAIGGGKPTMPKDDLGAVEGDELSLIAAWADAHDKAHAGGAHEDRGHGAGHDHGSGHEH
jgi:hypothetical protein